MLDIHGNELDPIWCAEFRGYFYGEGFLGIVSWGKIPTLNIPKLMVRAQITCRSDDAPVLADIHSKLGGIFYQEHKGRKTSNREGVYYQSNPYHVWRVTKADHIRRICDILSEGVLPARKRDQVAIIREFLATIDAPGKRVSQDTYILRQTLHEKIKALHQYSDC